MKTMKRIIAAILSLAVMTMMLCTVSGCAEKPTTATVMIIGARQNVPEPNMNSRIFRDCVSECVESYGYIAAMVCDADPSICLEYTIDPPAQAGLSASNLQKIADSKTGFICDKLQGLCADDEEADILTALYRASLVLSASSFEEGVHRKIVIYDSGLSTAGVLDFANENILDSDVDEIARQVTELFPVDLSMVDEVEWYGIGMTDTDDGQASLYPQQVSTLKVLWQKILTDAGTTVSFLSDSIGTGTENSELPKVSQVAILSPGRINGFDPCAITVMSESEVSFIKDTVEYTDPQAARAMLQPIAEYMHANPGFSILVCGSTATVGKNASCVVFSQGRAEAVKNTLIELGIDSERIEAVGLGYEHRFHVDDLDENGELVDSLAQQNRTVIIMNLDSDIAREITT